MPGHKPVQIAQGEPALAGDLQRALPPQRACDSLNFFSEVLQDSSLSRNPSSSAIQVKNGLAWKGVNFPNNAKSIISRPSVLWDATAFLLIPKYSLIGSAAQMTPSYRFSLNLSTPNTERVSQEAYTYLLRKIRECWLRARKTLTKHKVLLFARIKFFMRTWSKAPERK